MKPLKLITPFLLLFIFSFQAKSQLSLGGQLSYLNLFGGTGIKSIGLGLKADYGQSEKTVFTGGVNFFAGSKFSDIVYGNAFSSSTEPSQIEIDVEYKISFIHLYVGTKRYFAGEYEEDFGFYGIGEVGYLIAPIKTTLGSFDETLYWTMEEDGAKETLQNFILGFGLGYEKSFDFGYLFADLKLNIPANTANGVAVEVEIPASVSVNLGIRIPLN